MRELNPLPEMGHSLANLHPVPDKRIDDNERQIRFSPELHISGEHFFVHLVVEARPGQPPGTRRHRHLEKDSVPWFHSVTVWLQVSSSPSN